MGFWDNAPSAAPGGGFWGDMPQLSQHQVNAYKTLLDLSSPQERAQRLQELQQAAPNNAAAAQLHNTFQGYNQNQAVQGYQPSFGEQANQFAVNAVQAPIDSANNLTNIGLGGVGMLANAGAHLVSNQPAINATNQFVKGTIGAVPWVQQTALDKINGASQGQLNRQIIGNSLNDAANVESVLPVGRGVEAGANLTRTGLKGLGNAVKEGAIANLAPSIGMGTGQALIDPNNQTPIDVAKSAALNSAQNEVAGTALSAAGFGAGRGAALAGGVIRGAAKGIGKAGNVIRAANAKLGEDGFLSMSPLQVHTPVNPELPDNVKLAVADAGYQLQNIHNVIAQHQTEYAALKEAIEQSPQPQAAKNTQLRIAQDEANRAVTGEQRKIAAIHDHIKQLDPSGKSRPLANAAPPALDGQTGQDAYLAEQAKNQPLANKIGTAIGTGARKVVDTVKNLDERGAIDLNAKMGGKDVHPAQEVANTLAKEHADMLRSIDKEVGSVTRIPGENDAQLRKSTNSPFYRETFKRTGKAPTKADYLEQAHKELVAGTSPEAQAYQGALSELQAAKMPAAPKVAEAPKPLGEQIGRLKAQIAKEPDPNVKAELTTQLKGLNKQFSAEKNAPKSQSEVIADTLGLKPEERVPTAESPIGNPVDRAPEQQPKLSPDERRAVIAQDYQQTRNHVDMKVDEGNVKGAIAKATGVATEADQRLREAQDLGRKLSEHDRNLLYRVENGEDVKTVLKDAQHRKDFKEAATKLADAFDYNLAALRAAGSLTFKQHDYIIPHYYEATPEMMDKLEIKPEDRVTFGKKNGFHDKSAKYDSYIKAEKVGLHPLYDNPMDAVNQYRQGAGSFIRNNGLYEALKHAAPGQVADLGTVGDNAGTKFRQAAGRLPFNASAEVNNALKNFQDTKIANPYVRAGYNAARTVNGAQKALLFFGAPFHYMNITKNFLGLTTTTGHELIAGKGVADALKSALVPKGYAKVIEAARQDGTLAFAREDLGMQIGGHKEYRPDTLKGNVQSAIDKVNIFGATHRNMNNFIDAYGLTLARAAKEHGVKPGSEDAIKLGHEYNMVIGRLNGVVDGHNPFLDKFISDGALAPQYLRSQLGLAAHSVTKTVVPGQIEGKHGAGIYNAGDVARSTVVGTRVFEAALAITASAVATGQMPTMQKMLNEAGLNPNNPNANIQLTSKNKSGHGQVMNLPTDPAGLVAGLVTDPMHFGQARTSPALSAAQRFATNTDWNGNQIADPNAPNYNGKKLAGALLGNLPIGVQNLMGGLTGKLTPGQAVAQEFGGRVKTDPNDPAVQQAAAHFQAVKEATGKLGANDLATYNAINPQSKMADGSYTPASQFDPSKAPEKTLALLGHPNVLNAMIQINQAQTNHDPMWDLSNTDQTAVAGDGSPTTPLQAFMEHQVHQGTDYGGAQSKEDIQNNPWITQVNQDRSKFFATLPKSQNPSSQNPLQYPNIDPTTQMLMNQESSITDPAQKSAFFKAHPEVTAAYQQIADYTNAKRAQEGATPFAPSPQADAYTQAQMDAKNWKDPRVQQFLNANAAFKIAGPFGDGIGGAGGGRNTSQTAINNVSQGFQPNGKPSYASSASSANARNKIKNAIKAQNRDTKYAMKQSRKNVHKITYSPHTASLGKSYLGSALLKGIQMPHTKGRKIA